MAQNIYGLDIGTSNFKMCCDDTILNERNIIALRNKEIIAFGDEAYEMYEKSPVNINVSFPVKFGVIADIQNMQTLIYKFYEKISETKKASGAADFYIAIPTDVTEVEKRAFYDLVLKSKIKTSNVYVVDKPVADAIGAGLDVAHHVKGDLILPLRFCQLCLRVRLLDELDELRRQLLIRLDRRLGDQFPKFLFTHRYHIVSSYILSEVSHLKFPFCLSLLVLLGNILPLVVEFLTPGKTDLHFHKAAFKINL